MTLNGAIKQLHDLRSSDAMPVYFKPAIAEVINVLLSDVRENVRGEWIDVLRDTYGGGHFPYSKCSVCQSEQIMDSNFCPNCGADMRGES